MCAVLRREIQTKAGETIGPETHNPEVVSSNPAPATRRKDSQSQDCESFFALFPVFDADGTVPIQTGLDWPFWSANRRQGNLAATAVSAPSARTAVVG